MNTNIVGSIGFSGQAKKSTFFEWLIKKLTHSNFSHTFDVAEPYYGEDTVIEAGEAVQTVSLDVRYRQDPNAIYEIYSVNAPSSVTYQAFHDNYTREAGTGYGYLNLLWFLLWRFPCEWFYKHLTGKEPHFDWNVRNIFATGSFICSSESLDLLIRRGFESLFTNFNRFTITAEDIRWRLINSPNNFMLIEKKYRNGTIWRLSDGQPKPEGD
jgi:hypothetical protein